MVAWLLTHQAELQTYLLLGSFGCIAIWETFLPRRAFATPLGRRWLNNLALTVLGLLLIRLCLPLAAVAFAVFVERQGWGLFRLLHLPFWWSCGLGLLAIDLAGYAQHRLFHAVPLLWRFHRIHHSDLDVDCGTAIRHHPIETLIAVVLEIAVIAALGLPPLVVLTGALLIAIASVFNHGNVALPVGVDRPLRRIIVTPDMHRIHHSANVEESNHNFAMLFPWWDHLFASYRQGPQAGHERMELGLPEARDVGDVTLWKLLLLPLRPGPLQMPTGFDLARPRS